MRPPTISIALIASLALNVFLLATAAAVIAFAPRAEGVRPQPQPVMRRAAMSLDATHKAAFLGLLRAEGRAVRPANRQARALRLEVWDSLVNAQFNEAVAKQELAQARRLNEESRATVEDGVLDFAAGLPASQRAALGEALRRMIPQNAKPPVKPSASTQPP